MPSQRHITVRRAPKYVPFLVAGALLGAVAAAIVGYTGTVPDGYTRAAIFGYFLVIFVAVGVLLGGVVVLVLDRVSIARARKAIVEELPDEEPQDGSQEGPGRADDDGEQGPSAA
ncbi:hypothetical protein SPF06_04200 [Sinomonas sp. JGH33]|uniref:Potassium transporter Trk n=1 Tax=Sinomonas terricola TaxID=3110330 RepID=A0ABU5T2M7_9MICC|nr:hypothetical protein [Sinomonas sp. JGH33]MEA5453917.1 hypothetical protein [Sinomonas sp. JGH33]